MLGHLEAMLGYVRQLLLLLAVFGGYVGPFGGHVGPLAGYVGPFGSHAKTMFSNLWLYWRFLETMLGHLEAMFV